MPKSETLSGTSQADTDSLRIQRLKELGRGVTELRRLEKARAANWDRVRCLETTLAMTQYLPSLNKYDNHLAIVRAQACEALGLRMPK